MLLDTRGVLVGETLLVVVAADEVVVVVVAAVVAVEESAVFGLVDDGPAPC